MRYDKELKANHKKQEYMTKLEAHFKQNQNDADKLEKVITRISEFIDKLKQDGPVKKAVKLNVILNEPLPIAPV
jgi:hypothetical protein